MKTGHIWKTKTNPYARKEKKTKTKKQKEKQKGRRVKRFGFEAGESKRG